jgi:DNA-binding transcriptional ArsR family regulator
MTEFKDNLSLTFAALADPTRRSILAMLADGEKTVTQLAEPFQITQPAISKHLKVLERAGLIERGREAQWRPAHLRAEPLREASDWVEQYRLHWEDNIDRLNTYILKMQTGSDGVKEELPAPRIGYVLKGFFRGLGRTIERFWSSVYRREK